MQTTAVDPPAATQSANQPATPVSVSHEISTSFSSGFKKIDTTWAEKAKTALIDAAGTYLDSVIAKKEADLKASHADLEKRITDSNFSDSEKDQMRFDLDPSDIINELKNCKATVLIELNNIVLKAIDIYVNQVRVIESDTRRASILKENQVEAREKEFKIRVDALDTRLANRIAELLHSKK